MKFFNVPTDEADPDKIRSKQQAKEQKEEKLPLAELKKKVKEGFDLLKYSESDEDQMREEYLGENPIAADYELLLKTLRVQYKNKEGK